MSGLGQRLKEQVSWRRRASLVESVKLYAPGSSTSPRRTVDMSVFRSGPLAHICPRHRVQSHLLYKVPNVVTARNGIVLVEERGEF